MFNIFNKTPKFSHPNYKLIKSGPIGIVLQSVYGYSPSYQTDVLNLIDKILTNPETRLDGGYQLLVQSLDEDDRFYLNIIMTPKGKMSSTIFYVNPKSSKEYTLKSISEWNYEGGIEATVTIGKDYRIDAYIPNYLKHKESMKQNLGGSVSVKVSAIALQFQHSNLNKANNSESTDIINSDDKVKPQISDEFCGYFPVNDEEWGNYGIVNAIGDILSIEDLRIRSEYSDKIMGKIITVRLINDDSLSFTPEIFVSQEFINTNGPFNIGDKVFGVLWFNGMLVE